MTTRFAAACPTQDAAAIPWPALPALRCPQRSSRRSASCGCWRCAPGQFHAMPVVQSVLGGVRCEAHQQADFRRAVGRQMSPYDLPIGGIRPQKRASPRRRSRPRHCARCRFGCVPATRRVLPGDAVAAAAARRPARPFAGLPGHCSGKAASSPTAMPNRRCLRARGTYVLFIHIRLIRTALLSRHAASVSGLLRNKRAASGITRQWQWVGCLVRLRRRRRGKSSSS